MTCPRWTWCGPVEGSCPEGERLATGWSVCVCVCDVLYEEVRWYGGWCTLQVAQQARLSRSRRIITVEAHAMCTMQPAHDTGVQTLDQVHTVTTPGPTHPSHSHLPQTAISGRSSTGRSAGSLTVHTDLSHVNIGEETDTAASS
jgi:hypothetical protein